MAFVIKVKFEDILRRLRLENQPGNEGLSFAQLDARIRDLFGLLPADDILVTYSDKDGDIVTMAVDQDLTDALVYQSLNPLRLEVTLVNSKGSLARDAAKVKRRADGELKRLMKKESSSTPNSEIENVKQLFQTYRPLFESVTSAAQFRSLAENFLRTITSTLHPQVPIVGAEPKCAEYMVPKSYRAFGPGSDSQSHSHEGNTTRATVANSRTEVGARASSKVLNHKDGFHTKDAVHAGIICDVCGATPIVGIRWKSIKEYDYDMCNKCFLKDGNANDYTRIDQPRLRPQYSIGHGLRGGRHSGVMQDLFGARCGGRVAMHGFGGVKGKLDARFVCDVTMGDGTEVSPGAKFTKIWRLRNCGLVFWPVDTKLVHVGGDELGQLEMASLELPKQGLAPGMEIEVAVDFVAPQNPGRYVSLWRLALPTSGFKFGNQVWVLIQVVPNEILDHAAESAAPAHEIITVTNTKNGPTSGGSATLDTSDAEWVTLKKLESSMSFVNVGVPSTEDSIGATAAETQIQDLLRTEKIPSVESIPAVESSIVEDKFSEVPSAPASLDEPHKGVKATSEKIPIPSRALQIAGEYLFKFEEEGRDGASTLEGPDTKKATPLPVAAVELQSLSKSSQEEKDGLETPSTILVEIPEEYLIDSGEEKVAELTMEEKYAEETPFAVEDQYPDTQKLVGSVELDGKLEDYLSKSGEQDSGSIENIVTEGFTRVDSELDAFTELSVADPVEEDPRKNLLRKLETMGFTDSNLNLEVLEKNDLDLRKTLDDLCAIEEWDPILEELEEMGFYDTDMNRRLMYKNNGSVKRVVKDLVQMEMKDEGKSKMLAD